MSDQLDGYSRISKRQLPRKAVLSLLGMIAICAGAIAGMTVVCVLSMAQGNGAVLMANFFMYVFFVFASFFLLARAIRKQLDACRYDCPRCGAKMQLLSDYSFEPSSDIHYCNSCRVYIEERMLNSANSGDGGLGIN